MRDVDHRKQMLIQQIEAHRVLMRREVEMLREADPVAPVIRSGRQLLSVLGAIRSDRRAGTPLSQWNVELATTVLPTVIQVMRAVVRRRQEKRATEQPS